ncbi:MAG: hypothetical protein AB2L11_01070 [Syntrophobacteraceae bacterium]
MLTAPYNVPVNETTQAVLTIGSWALTAVLFGIAIRRDLQQRTPFYDLVVLSALAGAMAHPVFDIGNMLLFYVPGQWTVYSSFGVPQPVWTFSGYAVLYGGPALFICEEIRKGALTPNRLYMWAGIVFLASCIFEIYGINGGAYTYWGPHAFRIFNYPLAIGILETAQVVCFSLAAAELRRRSKGIFPLFGLFPLFLGTFYLANFGAGGLMITALHFDPPSPAFVKVCTVISIFFALVLIRAAAAFLPTVSGQPVSAESTS